MSPGLQPLASTSPGGAAVRPYLYFCESKKEKATPAVLHSGANSSAQAIYPQFSNTPTSRTVIDEIEECFFLLCSSASPASRPEHRWDHRRNKTAASATISDESGERSIRTKRGAYVATASKSQAKMKCRAGAKRQGADTLMKK